MTSLPPQVRRDATRRVAWSWIALALALAWVVLTRVPLVVNADHHLDSDLAVDGLTLAQALQGHWRWHYPGTPHMGILPVLLSLPQALVIGINPHTLVSGGVAAYVLVVLATFLLARRVFGNAVALWGLVPLAFASTGIVWLSGRITGGHLLAVAWHAAAMLLFHQTIRFGGVARMAALGFWCGLGIYLDGMLSATVLAIVAAGVGTWIVGSDPDRRWGCSALAFAVAFAIGYAPRVVGSRVDPYDAYGDPFATILTTPPDADGLTRRVDRKVVLELARQHGRLLVLDCLPRLLTGHRLPGLETEPDPANLGVPVRPGLKGDELSVVDFLTTWLTLPVAVLAGIALLVDLVRNREIAGVAVRLALLATSALVVAGFLINRNIFDSDNYRYLVLLIVPWSIGFGLLANWIARQGSGGRVLAAFLAISLSVLLTIDTHAWYARFGWVDGLRVLRVERPDPALEWLREQPDVSAIFGDYWDVYRLAFLTGGQVRGVPYPNYPNRFPEWSRDLPGGRPRILIARSTGLGPFYERSALAKGARELFRAPGVTIYDWP